MKKIDYKKTLKHYYLAGRPSVRSIRITNDEQAIERSVKSKINVEIAIFLDSVILTTRQIPQTRINQFYITFKYY